MKTSSRSFIFYYIEVEKVGCLPAEDFLPVDGVEVDDLVGLGRNDAVVKRSWWRRAGVCRGMGHDPF